jgi:hypothetical protein
MYRYDIFRQNCVSVESSKTTKITPTEICDFTVLVQERFNHLPETGGGKFIWTKYPMFPILTGKNKERKMTNTSRCSITH